MNSYSDITFTAIDKVYTNKSPINKSKKNKDMKVVNFDWFKINGQWVHCKWIRSEGKLKQYINGVLVFEQEQ